MPPEKTSGILFLTGISGSGKSAIARELARKLRCKMYDIDVLLTGSERMSVKSIFERKGESYFRRRERETIAELTRRLRSCGKRAVVSLGGGSLMNAATARLVARTGTLIYLVVSCREAARRLLKSYDRPLILDSDGKRLSIPALTRRLRSLLAERERGFARADHRVRVTNKPTERTCAAIIRLIEC